MAVDKGLMGGSTVYMLLSLLQEKPQYGYEIIKEIEKRSDNVFQMKEGTLYPVLHRMENQGYLESYKEKTESGKERKYYRITTKGQGQLVEEEKQWKEFTFSVARVVGGMQYGTA